MILKCVTEKRQVDVLAVPPGWCQGEGLGIPLTKPHSSWVSISGRALLSMGVHSELFPDCPAWQSDAEQHSVTANIFLPFSFLRVWHAWQQPCCSSGEYVTRVSCDKSAHMLQYVHSSIGFLWKGSICICEQDQIFFTRFPICLLIHCSGYFGNSSVLASKTPCHCETYRDASLP